VIENWKGENSWRFFGTGLWIVEEMRIVHLDEDNF
jgi:hypothetical protein